MAERLILDVGAGLRPQGNVNVDLFQWKDYADKKAIKKIRNPVKADAQHLPFRDKTFNIALCLHALEHIRNFRLALKEMIRVSKDRVIVHVPHRYYRSRFFNRKLLRLHFFGTSDLRKTIQTLGYDPELKVIYGCSLYPFPRYIEAIIHLRAYKQPFEANEFVQG